MQPKKKKKTIKITHTHIHRLCGDCWDKNNMGHYTTHNVVCRTESYAMSFHFLKCFLHLAVCQVCSTCVRRRTGKSVLNAVWLSPTTRTEWAGLKYWRKLTDGTHRTTDATLCKEPFTLMDNLASSFNICVFGKGQEAGVPRGNPHKYRENIQTLSGRCAKHHPTQAAKCKQHLSKLVLLSHKISMAKSTF